MSLKNATVALTYKILGVITSFGIYEYRERTTSGSMIEESQRLFTKKNPEESDCFKVVKLGEAFVNYAISDEGRPKRHGNFKAYTFWRKMSETERLAFHIARYVADMNSTKYTYEIYPL